MHVYILYCFVTPSEIRQFVFKLAQVAFLPMLTASKYNNCSQLK